MAASPNDRRNGLIWVTLVGLVMCGVSVHSLVEQPLEVGDAAVSSLPLGDYLAIGCSVTQPMADGSRACLSHGEWIGLARDVERLGTGRFAGVLRSGQSVREANPRPELPAGVAYPERHLAARPGTRAWGQLVGSIVLLVICAVGWIAWARARRRNGG